LERATSAARPGAVVAILLHHHVLPLPADHTAEWVCSWLGWPYANELEKGADLLARLRGRCDLVLHGHRHTPQAITLFENEPRPLSVLNAGSSTELGRVRVFFHHAGRLRPGFGWLPTGESPTERYEAGVVGRAGRLPGASRAA
ncbi:MAG TPA: metallophosphoesterase, partial [Polyangia bacterium]|nr:metallophosphoesterase [Polyangia bacterium]